MGSKADIGYDEGIGKRKTLSIYGATQKEVKKKMTEKLRQLDTNTYIADDKRTLAQYLDNGLLSLLFQRKSHIYHDLSRRHQESLEA